MGATSRWAPCGIITLALARLEHVREIIRGGFAPRRKYKQVKVLGGDPLRNAEGQFQWNVAGGAQSKTLALQPSTPIPPDGSL